MTNAVTLENVLANEPKKKESKTKNLWFYAIVLIMLSIYLLKHAFGVNIPMLVFLVISAIPIFLGTPSHIIAYAVCCMPLGTGFQYKYALLMCCIAYLFRARGRIKLKPSVVCLLILFFWELLHGLYGIFSPFEYLRSIAELLFIAIVLACKMDKLDYKMIFRAMSLATVGICFVILFLQLQYNDFDFQSILSFRFGKGNVEEEVYNLTFNANGLGSICNMSALGMLILINRKEHLPTDFVLMFISLIFGFMTMSRSFIVCLLFILVMFFFFGGKGIKSRLRSSIYTALVVIGIAVAVAIFIPEVYYSILDRFAEDDVSNGRIDLFFQYNTLIWTSPLVFFFGVGYQDFQNKLGELLGSPDPIVPHMGLQEVWLVWGVFGLAVFLLFLYYIIKETKGQTKRNIILFLPLMVRLLATMFGQLVRGGAYLLTFVLCIVALSIDKYNESSDMDPKESRRK